MPKKAHYRKFGVRSLDGQDDFAAMAEVSRAASRGSRNGAPPTSTTSRSPRRPNLVVIDGGKGQLSAALAGDAGLRPAARRGHRARQARRGGLRPGPARSRSCSTASSPGLQLLQRVRDEAHRFALGFHRQRRGREGARVDLRHAAGRRPGAPARAAAALRLAGALPRRVAGGARGRSRASRRRRRARSTRSCTRPGERSSVGRDPLGKEPEWA